MCAGLRLTCHGYGSRPDWMDGGTKEREQARIFASVVRRATMRKHHQRALDRLREPTGVEPEEPVRSA